MRNDVAKLYSLIEFAVTCTPNLFEKETLCLEHCDRHEIRAQPNQREMNKHCGNLTTFLSVLRFVRVIPVPWAQSGSKTVSTHVHERDPKPEP